MIDRAGGISICDRPICAQRAAWLKFAIATVGLLLLLAPAGKAATGHPDVKAAIDGAWFWDLDWTVADFDGDRVPDVAKAEIEEQSGNDTLYHVTLQLSGVTASAFDVRTSERPQLQISARDIDGDHDPDLVITAGAQRQPVGIWLNDGKGSFTPTDASVYADSIWQDPPTASHPNTPGESLIANTAQARFSAPSPEDQSCESPSRRVAFVQTKPISVRSTFLDGQLQVRPPPSSSEVPA